MPPPSGSVFPIGPTTVHCTATDRAGNTASADFLVSIGGPANQPATGAPTIDDTTLTETLPLAASVTGIADPDNTDRSRAIDFHYQWRSATNAGATFVDIPGATSTTFTPTQCEVGRVLRVQVSFTDQRGNAEQLESSITRVTGAFIAGKPAAETITGTAGDDIVQGNGGDDTISTLAGDDRIRFSGTDEGFDSVSGDAGADEIEATPGTIIGLRAVQAVERITGSGTNVRIRGNDAGNRFDFGAVALTGIAAIVGGAGPDVITGSAGQDVIRGGLGNDVINGGPRDDVLDGGAGGDAIIGAAGSDRLVLTADFGADTVADFDANRRADRTSST